MENKMKLLLIEDDINACEIFKKIERARKEIEFIKITNSETEGLKCVKQNAPEGIILDLELTNGEGSGFGFIKELRKLKLKTIPKIIVTTNICTDSVYDYLHANKVDFIFYKKQDSYSEENVINTLLLLRGYSDSSDYTVTTVKNDVEEYEKENNEHPELRAAHKALAREIITFLHGKEEYEKAVNLADHLFNNKFNDLSKSDIEELFGSEDIKEVTPNQTIVDMLVEMKAVSSKREAKEFVTNGAISVNGEKINDISEIIDESKFIENTYIVVKRGKKNYYIGKKK